MVHNLIAAAVLLAFAVAVAVIAPEPGPGRDLAAAPARALRWWLARRRWARATRRAARAAWVAGADLVAGLAAAAALDEQRPPCQRCRGRRCWYARNGVDCPAPSAPRMTDTLGGTGRHEPAAVLRGIVPGGWSPFPPRMRRRLAPLAWAVRMGVPPIGVLP